MDRLDAWRIFVAVASARSFGRGARSLGRSPQAATRAVAALEATLGTRLLNRTTRSVSVTDDGERYLDRARRTLAEVDLLESSPEDGAPLRGVVTVTAPVLFGRLHVAPVVLRLLAAHPEVDVRLLLLDRVVSLAEEGIDVGVRIGALPDSTLYARVVGSVRPVVCASPRYLARHGVPRSPEALGQHTCIAFTGTTPIADRWSFRRRGGRERSVVVRPRLVVTSGPVAIDAALAGFGIVRALSYQVEAHVRAGRLRVLFPTMEADAVPVQIVYPGKHRTRTVTRLITLLTDRIMAPGGSRRTHLSGSAAPHGREKDVSLHRPTSA